MTLAAVVAELASLIQREGAGVDSSGKTAQLISHQWRQWSKLPNIPCRKPASKAFSCSKRVPQFSSF